MTVTVRLFATFRAFLPQEAMCTACAVDMAADDTVRDLVAALRLPADLPRIILVNGKHAAEGDLLCEGDQVAIFPPLIGGR
jgi:molybdopterin converting factor small subunit